MKKRGSKLRKFFLRTLLSLVFFSSVIAVATRNPWVQTKLAKYAVHYLSTKLHTKITLSGVEIDFLRNFHFEDLTIYDQQNDTIFYAKSFDFRVSYFSFSDQKINLQYLELNHLVSKLGFYPKQKKQNFEFIFDYLSSKDTSTKGSNWKINIRNIDLIESRFTQFDYELGKVKLIDSVYEPTVLALSNLNAKLPYWNVDELGVSRFQIKQLACRDRSGLTIKSLKSTGEISDKHILLDNMELRTPNCKLGPKFEMKYKNFNAFDDMFHQVIYSLDLRNSILSLQDLYVFHPWLRNRALPFTVSTHIEGPLSNLSTTFFKATTQTGTSLDLSYSFTGLPNTNQLINNIDFASSAIQMSDLKTLMPELQIPQKIIDLGKVNLWGNLDLPDGTLSWDGEIKTNYGNVNGLLDLDYRDSSKPLSYMLNASLDSVNWAKIQPELQQLGSANMGVYLKGSGTDKNAELEFDINSSDYRWNHHDFNKLSVEGSLTQGTLLGKFISKDPAANWVSDFQIEDVFDNPNSSINAEISNLDFVKLGIDTVETSFKGNVNIHAEGFDINTMKGTAFLQNCKFKRNDIEFDLNRQTIDRQASDMLIFDGDWVNGEITGKWKFTESQHWVQQILHQTIPSRFKAAENNCSDSFGFKLFITQTDWIRAFFAPDLKLGPVNVQGHFNGIPNDYFIQLGPCALDYNSISANKLKLILKHGSNSNLPTQLELSTTDAQLNQTFYDNLILTLNIDKNEYELDAELHERDNRYAFQLGGQGQIYSQITDFNFTQTDIRIYNNKWQLEKEAQLFFNDKSFIIRKFYLSDNEHYLEVNGDISAKKSDTLHLEFSNMSPSVLKPFLPKGSIDSFEFKANGDLKISSVLKNPKFTGSMSVNRIKYNRFSYGDMDVSMEETEKVGNVKLFSRFRSGVLTGMTLNGNMNFGKGETSDIDFYGEIPRKTSIKVLQPFLGGIVSFKEGFVRGNFHVFGKSDNPKAEGLISVEQTKIKVDYLQTEYSLAGNLKVTEKGIFTVRPIKVYDDSKKNFGLFKMAFTYENFSHFGIDMRFDSLRNIKVLNTTEKDNSLFYGTAWADGNCHIYGTTEKVNMDINLTPRKNSVVAIQYSSTTENKISGSIIFRNHLGKVIESSIRKTLPSSIGKIAMNISATPEAEVQFVIDKKLGDVIKGRGTGNLRLVYDNDEKLYLYGSYVVESGEYAFSLPGINLLKRILLDKGGNIIWSGDPFNATVDLQGRVEKKISPSTLMISSGNAGTTYPTTRVVSILLLKGNLFSPQIGFDIQAPDLLTAGGTSATEVNSVIQRIRSDKDETMRQAVSLLIFGNFIPPSFSSTGTSANSFSGSGFAGNSVSNIASTVVNDLFSKYGVPTRIQVNIDDVRNSSGNANTKLFVNTEWFLTDRLRLDLNYDPTVAVLVNSMAVPFNFNLEYKTSDENWRLKAFSRSNNLLLQNTSTSNVSGNTLGVGVLYRREFETLRRKKKTPR